MLKTNAISELSRGLHKLVFFSDKVAECLLHEHFKLTFSQFRMLMAVEKGGGLCQADIAEFFGLTPAAVSRQLELLKRKKLLKITENSKNRREHRLSLTKAGRDCTNKARIILEKSFHKLYAVLDRREQQNFRQSLEKIIHYANSKGKDHFCRQK